MSELLGHDYSLLELIKIRAANSLFYCIKKNIFINKLVFQNIYQVIFIKIKKYNYLNVTDCFFSYA